MSNEISKLQLSKVSAPIQINEAVKVAEVEETEEVAPIAPESQDTEGEVAINEESSKTEASEEKPKSRIGRFFQKIWNAIKEFFGIGKNEKDDSNNVNSILDATHKHINLDPQDILDKIKNAPKDKLKNQLTDELKDKLNGNEDNVAEDTEVKNGEEVEDKDFNLTDEQEAYIHLYGDKVAEMIAKERINYNEALDEPLLKNSSIAKDQQQRLEEAIKQVTQDDIEAYVKLNWDKIQKGR